MSQQSPGMSLRGRATVGRPTVCRLSDRMDLLEASLLCVGRTGLGQIEAGRRQRPLCPDRCTVRDRGVALCVVWKGSRQLDWNNRVSVAWHRSRNYCRIDSCSYGHQTVVSAAVPRSGTRRYDNNRSSAAWLFSYFLRRPEPAMIDNRRK